MQKDIRVSKTNSINTNHISILKGDMLFFASIIEKYGIETKLKLFPHLQYLLKNRFHEISLNFQHFSTIQKKLYSNYNHIRNIRNIFSHENKNLVHNKILKKENQNIVGFYNKDLINNTTVFNQNLLNNKTLTHENQNITSFYNKGLIDNPRILNHENRNVTNLYYQDSLSNKTLKKENQNITSILNNKIFNKRITIQKPNTLYKNFSHNIVLLPHQSRTLNYDQNINNKIDATIIYAQEEKKTLAEPIIDEKVLKKVIKETNIVENNKNNLSTIIETNINNLNPYDIKKLATKIYPLIMTQWQKEFERRGVFYG